MWDLVAQLVEHLPFKERVLGSSPSQVTEKVKFILNFFFTFNIHNAHVAELVDALAWGASGNYSRGSSSLLVRTFWLFKFNILFILIFELIYLTQILLNHEHYQNLL